ncbi:hypothetical protein [Mesomycoplasma ovipneumoniae]|uniref:hypothetical protein n=1 Tax=Mesomycoplasma ovipneumoniae TaxID=29562 RepID=UPI0029640921|nr:hypothetical protein [Mesomycoplasma ovipneumoniae]MDW2861311.1 hypothetical protein [Mesomycoplasma ovipneumoniae]
MIFDDIKIKINQDDRLILNSFSLEFDKKKSDLVPLLNFFTSYANLLRTLEKQEVLVTSVIPENNDTHY